MLCEVNCKCPLCYQVPVVEVLESQPDPLSQASSTSCYAADNKDVPPPGCGLVKKLCKRPAGFAPVLKRPASSSGGSGLEVKLRRRFKDIPEAYIMVEGNFWAGHRLAKHPSALAFVEELKEKVEMGW